MEWESDGPCLNHTYLGQECRSSGKHSGWELEFRDCEAIPGWGLLLNEERQIEGMWGWRLLGGMPMEESQAAMGTRWYCWVMCRGWSHHHSHSPHMPASTAEQQSGWPIKCLTHWTHPGCSFEWLMPRTTERLYRKPSKSLNGQSHRERLAKESFWSPAQEAQKKFWQGHNSCSRGSLCPFILVAARVPTSQAAALPSHSTPTVVELPQAKMSCIYAHRVTSVESDSLIHCRLWPVRLLCQVGGFSRQEHWSVLADTGCHALLEHYMLSCCPSYQFPWVPGAARTPATQAAAPRLHLALTGINPSLPGQPQEWTAVDDPHAEVEIKTTFETQGQCG